MSLFLRCGNALPKIASLGRSRFVGYLLCAGHGNRHAVGLGRAKPSSNEWTFSFVQRTTQERGPQTGGLGPIAEFVLRCVRPEMLPE